MTEGAPARAAHGAPAQALADALAALAKLSQWIAWTADERPQPARGSCGSRQGVRAPRCRGRSDRPPPEPVTERAPGSRRLTVGKRLPPTLPRPARRTGASIPIRCSRAARSPSRAGAG